MVTIVVHNSGSFWKYHSGQDYDGDPKRDHTFDKLPHVPAACAPTPPHLAAVAAPRRFGGVMKCRATEGKIPYYRASGLEFRDQYC